MDKVIFPYVNLPKEFTTLLKKNSSHLSQSSEVVNAFKSQKAIFGVLETSLSEFDEGQGLEKVFLALGWSGFRDRLASIYISKTIYGDFPRKSNLELIEDIKQFEARLEGHSVNSSSRLFLLGLYLKLANYELQIQEDNRFFEIKIPANVDEVLNLSQVKSDKIDWLILIIYHLQLALGEKMLTNCILNGKNFNDIYELLSINEKEVMARNLLAYGASIQDSELFLFEKV